MKKDGRIDWDQRAIRDRLKEIQDNLKRGADAMIEADKSFSDIGKNFIKEEKVVFNARP
jgi:hypothetical protein